MCCLQGLSQFWQTISPCWKSQWRRSFRSLAGIPGKMLSILNQNRNDLVALGMQDAL